MATKTPLTVQSEQALMAAIWSPELSDDPEAWIMFAFPWGKPGTPLANKKGLRQWQKEECARIKEHIKVSREKIAKGETPDVFKLAVTSGRGTGKSAFIAMISLWLLSCVRGITIILTANTEDQLKNKTMAEIGKWHTLMINSHWFEKNAMTIRPAQWYEDLLKKQLKIDTSYYYISATLWSETNPDAFAGTHNDLGIVLLMDEASGIPPAIWKVSDGFFTEKILHRYWFCFSNPRRNTGTFFECFHKMRKWWHRRKINALEVEESDQKTYLEIIEKYGEQSDEARVEVYGEFPKQGDRQFISRSIIEGAVEREIEYDGHAPLVMGVDVARYGDDSTVIALRKGRDARSRKWHVLKDQDNMQVANYIARLMDEHNPDAVFIDSGGGTGVIDRLKEMKYKVFEVQFGGSSSDPQWPNKRTEMWAEMRDWLGGACIPNDEELTDDLAGPEFKINKKDQTALESKDEMKSRGLASPDRADALAVTFARRVARSDARSGMNSKRGRQAITDYSILG